MLAHDLSARFLSNLMKSDPYRTLPPDQRIGWRRAVQSLKARRDALAEFLVRTGWPTGNPTPPASPPKGLLSTFGASG